MLPQSYERGKFSPALNMLQSWEMAVIIMCICVHLCVSTHATFDLFIFLFVKLLEKKNLVCSVHIANSSRYPLSTISYHLI